MIFLWAKPNGIYNNLSYAISIAKTLLQGWAEVLRQNFNHQDQELVIEEILLNKKILHYITLHYINIK